MQDANCAEIRICTRPDLTAKLSSHQAMLENLLGNMYVAANQPAGLSVARTMRISHSSDKVYGTQYQASTGTGMPLVCIGMSTLSKWIMALFVDLLSFPFLV